jgi:DNA-binding CsgD family transcriptional regulator
MKAEILSPRALSTLIGSIYDCAINPDCWDETLVRIRDALACHNAMLHLDDLHAGRVLFHKHAGSDWSGFPEFQKYAPAMHALLPADPDMDEPYVLSRHVTGAAAASSPFVQEWLKPQGVVDVMLLFLVRTSSRLSGLGLAWHERHGVVTEAELDLARLLLPHVRRAATISNVLDASTIERSRTTEALDALACAVMLVDARGRVVYANRSAECLLQEGRSLRNVAGMLQAVASPATVELKNAIRLATQDEARIGRAGLAIPLGDAGVAPLFAHVLPMTGSDLRTGLQATAVAAIFVGVPTDQQSGAELMAAAYDLTPAETRVLAHLLAGRTSAETSEALGIAANTTKTHLTSIFSKTGVSRQADLMRLGNQIVPPLRPASV